MTKRIAFLPATVMNRIALFTGERDVLEALKDLIDYELLMTGLHPEKTLLYGPVQSGKTEAIANTIKNPRFAGFSKVLVIQNSLSVLKQYQQRLKEYGISYHVVGPQSHSLTHIAPDETILLMNNRHRYAHYLKMPCKPTKYIALLDESDMYKTGSHPVSEGAHAQFYVTATPFHRAYTEEGYFNCVKKIKPTDNYTGLKDVSISYKNLPEAVAEFMGTPTGMMLINSVSYVHKMKILAQELSNLYPDTPILVLNDKKWAYRQGVRTRIRKTKISAIIDRFKGHSHIIFIANRLSLRGLSYVSSDYSRYLTHQFSNFYKLPITSCIQKLRILGKRGTTRVPSTLYLGEEVMGIRKKMEKIMSMIETGVDRLAVDAHGFKVRPEFARII